MHPCPMENEHMIVSASMASAVFCGITCRRYDAHGCPSLDPRTSSILTTVYATTNWRNQPSIPPIPLERTIALGEAIFELEHSSLK